MAVDHCLQEAKTGCTLAQSRKAAAHFIRRISHRAKREKKKLKRRKSESNCAQGSDFLSSSGGSVYSVIRLRALECGLLRRTEPVLWLRQAIARPVVLADSVRHPRNTKQEEQHGCDALPVHHSSFQHNSDLRIGGEYIGKRQGAVKEIEKAYWARLKPVGAVGDPPGGHSGGMVAATAHQKGRRTSASKPSAVKVSQKTLRCIQIV